MIEKDNEAIFVKSFIDLQKRIKEWSDSFLSGEKKVLDVASKTTHWYYSPIYDTFGPSNLLAIKIFLLVIITQTN